MSPLLKLSNSWPLGSGAEVEISWSWILKMHCILVYNLFYFWTSKRQNVYMIIMITQASTKIIIDFLAFGVSDTNSSNTQVTNKACVSLVSLLPWQCLYWWLMNFTSLQYSLEIFPRYDEFSMYDYYILEPEP